MITVDTKTRFRCDACNNERELRDVKEGDLPPGWEQAQIGGRNVHICSSHKVILLKVDDKVIGAKQLDK